MMMPSGDTHTFHLYADGVGRPAFVDPGRRAVHDLDDLRIHAEGSAAPGPAFRCFALDAWATVAAPSSLPRLALAAPVLKAMLAGRDTILHATDADVAQLWPEIHEPANAASGSPARPSRARIAAAARCWPFSRMAWRRLATVVVDGDMVAHTLRAVDGVEVESPAFRYLVPPIWLASHYSDLDWRRLSEDWQDLDTSLRDIFAIDGDDLEMTAITLDAYVTVAIGFAARRPAAMAPLDPRSYLEIRAAEIERHLFVVEDEAADRLVVELSPRLDRVTGIADVGGNAVASVFGDIEPFLLPDGGIRFGAFRLIGAGFTGLLGGRRGVFASVSAIAYDGASLAGAAAELEPGALLLALAGASAWRIDPSGHLVLGVIADGAALTIRPEGSGEILRMPEGQSHIAVACLADGALPEDVARLQGFLSDPAALRPLRAARIDAASGGPGEVPAAVWRAAHGAAAEAARSLSPAGLDALRSGVARCLHPQRPRECGTDGHPAEPVGRALLEALRLWRQKRRIPDPHRQPAIVPFEALALRRGAA